MDTLDKLLSISGAGLSPAAGEVNSEYLASWGRLGVELAQLLQRRNGFYAFESALHVRPVDSSGSIPGDLATWNSPSLWRDEYGTLAADLLFFAEDVFGGQFALDRNGNVVTFEPETAETEPVASTVEEWVDQLLADYNFLTGFPLAHEWQSRHGLLEPGNRLLPKMPFVAGGKYEVENLYSLDAIKGMRFRGSIARQIAELPDGAQIRFEISED